MLKLFGEAAPFQLPASNPHMPDTGREFDYGKVYADAIEHNNRVIEAYNESAPPHKQIGWFSYRADPDVVRERTEGLEGIILWEDLSPRQAEAFVAGHDPESAEDSPRFWRTKRAVATLATALVVLFPTGCSAVAEEEQPAQDIVCSTVAQSGDSSWKLAEHMEEPGGIRARVNALESANPDIRRQGMQRGQAVEIPGSKNCKALEEVRTVTYTASS